MKTTQNKTPDPTIIQALAQELQKQGYKTTITEIHEYNPNTHYIFVHQKTKQHKIHIHENNLIIQTTNIMRDLAIPNHPIIHTLQTTYTTIDLTNPNSIQKLEQHLKPTLKTP